MTQYEVEKFEKLMPVEMEQAKQLKRIADALHNLEWIFFAGILFFCVMFVRIFK